MKQSSDSHLHSLDTVAVVLNPKEVLVLESIHIADDLHNSLQERNLSGRSLLQDYEGPCSVRSSATPGIASCLKALLRTEWLSMPRARPFFTDQHMSGLDAKSILRLQILFESSRVTSAAWLIPTRTMSRMQPVSIQSSAVLRS